MSLFSGIFCGGTACSMERQLPSGVRAHRSAEVLSTQGNAGYTQPMQPPPYIAEQGFQDLRYRMQMQNGRTPMVKQHSALGGSFTAVPGTASGSTANFNEVLGGHLPCTAAALGSQEAIGRGLYVSMQRGLSYDQDNGLHRQPRSFELPSALGTSSPREDRRELLRKPAKIRAESPGRMIPASNYEGAVDDSIDAVVAEQCKLLLPHRAKALLIRRIAPGEYEIDGAPVRFTVSQETREVMVCTPGLEHEGSEPLSRYLPRAAETAVARAPPDFELPAFPWAIDPLSKTTSGTRGNNQNQVDSLGLTNISNTMHSMPVKAMQDPTNLSKMMKPGPPMLPKPKAGHHPVGAPVAGPQLSAVPRAPSLVVPNSRQRPVPRSPSLIIPAGARPSLGPPGGVPQDMRRRLSTGFMPPQSPQPQQMRRPLPEQEGYGGPKAGSWAMWEV